MNPPEQEDIRPSHNQHTNPSTTSATKELFATIGVLAAALLVALALIGFVFQSYEVDGPSMQNTLHDQDRLIVWKAQRTIARITNNQYIPNRGDIIVFVENNLSEYGQANSKQLIKRVIGMPGDRVVVKNGEITVYNSEHPKGFKPDVELPYGSQTEIPYTSGNIDLTLDADEIFVCGDNRGDSLDSRSFGPIKSKEVVGKLVARVFPFKDAEIF